MTTQARNEDHEDAPPPQAEVPATAAQTTLFASEASAARPPLRHRKRAALRLGDGSVLNREQVAEAEVFLEELIQQRPQASYAPGKHRCETFPDCDHAGCNVLKQLQEGAKKLLERWRVERRSPRQALLDIQNSERELDRTLTELERARRAGRRAS